MPHASKSVNLILKISLNYLDFLNNLCDTYTHVMWSRDCNGGS